MLSGVGALVCRRADVDRTVNDASNAAGHAVDVTKLKGQQAADVAQDYSKQAGDKAADSYGTAKANTEQVEAVFRSCDCTVWNHSL